MSESPAGPSNRRRIAMALARVGAVAVSALIAVVALPSSASADTTVASTQTGTSNGYFYSFWSDGVGQAAMMLGAAGQYSTTFNNVGHFIAGKGWKTGGRWIVNYSGTLSASGNAYVELYGWTTSPLVEYRIVENYSSAKPTGTIFKGTIVSDGGVYNIYETTRINQPSPVGIASFNTYWAVRQSKRTGGAITTANYFNAWANYGMTMGTFNYMILATEAYQSSGSSNITVIGGATTSTTTTTS
jgi:endo-1,4-beta-xylanase